MIVIDLFQSGLVIPWWDAFWKSIPDAGWWWNWDLLWLTIKLDRFQAYYWKSQGLKVEPRNLGTILYQIPWWGQSTPPPPHRLLPCHWFIVLCTWLFQIFWYFNHLKIYHYTYRRWLAVLINQQYLVLGVIFLPSSNTSEKIILYFSSKTILIFKLMLQKKC